MDGADNAGDTGSSWMDLLKKYWWVLAILLVILIIIAGVWWWRRGTCAPANVTVDASSLSSPGGRGERSGTAYSTTSPMASVQSAVNGTFEIVKDSTL